MDNLLSGRKILVVEDEMLVLMMIEDMLTDLGCEAVTVAATVEQALAQIDTQTFDAVMLDMNLNGNTTYSVADVLALRMVPFVFSTGYSGHDTRYGYRDRPMLKKPFRVEELAAVFTNLLSDRS
jgi:CheY-like chemotaxis protein